MPLVDTTTVWCDNSRAITVSTNLVLHFKFKHVELDLLFVLDKVIVGKLKVGHVPAQEHVVDILTKSLSKPYFSKFRGGLGIVSKELSSWGNIRVC